MKIFFPIIIAFALFNSSCLKENNSNTSNSPENVEPIPQSVPAPEWAIQSLRVLKSRVEQAESALTNYVPSVIPIPKAESQSELAHSKLLAFTGEAFRAEANIIINRIIYEEAKAGRVTRLPDVFIESNDISTKLIDWLNIDYERSLRYEKALKELLEKMRLEENRVNESIIQYKVLKQKLETAQLMYEEFVKKAEQTGIDLSKAVKEEKNTL
jgi:hypothetical protein